MPLRHGGISCLLLEREPNLEEFWKLYDYNFHMLETENYGLGKRSVAAKGEVRVQDKGLSRGFFRAVKLLSML